ncbi:hypothetical protein [Flexithrix dorotheae]|uniref:hypothetical protein n=1 Tax=Flexithrix dorotheae TaxID=70993 RepID=UPI000370EA06|nr:hypothetical protein [Flexithrix dorotheae]
MKFLKPYLVFCIIIFTVLSFNAPVIYGAQNQDIFIEGDSSKNTVNYIAENQDYKENKKYLVMSDEDIEKKTNELAGIIPEVTQTNGDTFTPAYFTWGTVEELKSDQILNEKGEVSIEEDPNQVEREVQEKFMMVDMEELSTLPILGENPELISEHPSGTFKLETKGAPKLVILDKDRFWSASPFLVIKID